MAHARPPSRSSARRRYVVLGAVSAIVLFVAVGYAAARPSDGGGPSAAPATTGVGPEAGAPAQSLGPPDSVGVGRKSTATPSESPSTATPTPSSATPTPSSSGRDTPTPTPPRRRPGTAAWTPGVHYRPGDAVTHRGGDYVCRQAHTAQADWQPQDTPTLWRSA
ncbi:carbohydrate-binding protein [Actinomadura sp. 3N508]|uniref:carbohydrate-binding protein n=1 Tax=Actinomadura sp. 3N508 TaxID=3375153 RepID=UPI0037A9F482